MRGSPLLRLILVIAGMLALLVPLRSLTMRPAVSAESAAIETSVDQVPIQIALSSTKVPFQFEVSYLGTPIWTGDAETHEVQKDLTMHFPKEGIDLFVSGSWPNAGPAALRITVTRLGGDPITKMLWGDGRVSDVLTFE